VEHEPPILPQRLRLASGVTAVGGGAGHHGDPVCKIGRQRENVVGHLGESPRVEHGDLAVRRPRQRQRQIAVGPDDPADQTR
jgi:hypothetical protein